MKNSFYKSILIYLALTLILNSCNSPELSNPKTIYGMKLGLDFESQTKIAEKNGICKNDLPDNQICQYKLTETVYARPELLYSLFNEKKVLSEIKLILNSPFEFLVVKNGFEDGSDAEYPSLRMKEINEIISMFKIKYGNTEVTKTGDFGTCVWTQGDLNIKLEYQPTLYAYGYNIHPQIKDSFREDAYYVQITYCYVDEMEKLLKNEKSHNGEPIGDKI
jgi:hypothetical protein